MITGSIAIELEVVVEPGSEVLVLPDAMGWLWRVVLLVRAATTMATIATAVAIEPTMYFFLFVKDNYSFCDVKFRPMVYKRRFAFVLTLIILSISACGSSVKASSNKLDGTYKPQKSLGDAVTAVLTAEKANDFAASFALLDPSSRSTYKDVADWKSRLNELPAVTGFNLGSNKGTNQTATVNHKPGLDPFKGLSPASETQIWVGHKYSTGWLVEADPATTPILPADSLATTTAKAWTVAVQACNKDAAHALQAIDPIIATNTPTLCKVAGEPVASAPTALTAGPDSQDIVDQYTTDALTWARTVSITGPATFHVVLAPLGDGWKVFAIY